MRYILPLMMVLLSLATAQEFAKAIEDNSFFIEEAYNQEEHVVQHIFNSAVSSNGIIFANSFTQEWPLFGQLHQLSFTLPFQFSVPKNSTSQGVGDLIINYRYQLVSENTLAVAPRFSIILPTGNEKKGFGNGVTGIQFNLPVSKRFSDEIVTHYNAGFTFLPQAKDNFSSSTATITTYSAGVSGIYLANDHFNVMTEVLYTSSGSKFGRMNGLIISPGLRWAIDIDELQIVPGIAFPFYFNSGAQENGLLLYLSFEHPY
jgi:hypothetical protein